MSKPLLIKRGGLWFCFDLIDDPRRGGYLIPASGASPAIAYGYWVRRNHRAGLLA